MSYHSTGAEVVEWIGGIAIPTIPAKLRTQRRSGRARQDLGACCSSCAQDGLGATPQFVATPTGAQRIQTAPPPTGPGAAGLPPGVFPPAPPAPNPIAKVIVIGGLGLVGFLLYRKFRGAPKAA